MAKVSRAAYLFAERVVQRSEVTNDLGDVFRLVSQVAHCERRDDDGGGSHRHRRCLDGQTAMTPQQEKAICAAVRRFLAETLPEQRVKFLLRVYGITAEDTVTIIGDEE